MNDINDFIPQTKDFVLHEATAWEEAANPGTFYEFTFLRESKGKMPNYKVVVFLPLDKIYDGSPMWARNHLRTGVSKQLLSIAELEDAPV